jgi:hypothetical protein
VNERVSERGSGRVSKWVVCVGESERAGGLSRASTSYSIRTYGQCSGDWICRTYGQCGGDWICRHAARWCRGNRLYATACISSNAEVEEVEEESDDEFHVRRTAPLPKWEVLVGTGLCGCSSASNCG